MKILICGDSYCVPDPEYANLHWSEKILSSSQQTEIINLAYGGCSNALIALQLMQGLRFNPDFIIFSFTNEGRYEFDKDKNAVPVSLTEWDISSYIKDRFTTSHYPMTSAQQDAYRLWCAQSSDEFEKIKNYFFICFCLMTVKEKNIRFCYSLGGFEYKQDYTALLNRFYLKNLFLEFHKNELSTNLWYHGRNQCPFFHVNDEKILTLFANECIQRCYG